jgi:cytochrome c-type biogenesis protein CcmF
LVLASLILLLALAFYLIDFFAVLTRRFRFGLYSTMTAGLLSIAASVWFSWYFISDNFTLEAVYEHSSRSLPLVLKIAASWTGAGGSFLLWLLLMTVAVLAFRIKDRRSMDDQLKVVSLVMSFFTMTIVGFALATNPFSELSASVPDGLGLNPSLQTILSMIHPPLVFAAYGAMLLSYSFVLARSWTRKAESDFAEVIIWRSWIVLTLGISIGGFWAYETLGWGGYWGWDPVETSALVPWLALTALLFAKQIGLNRDHDVFTMTFAASSLFFTVYIARSAAVPSVHSYGDIIAGNAILLLAVVPVFLSYMAVRRTKSAHSETQISPFPAILVFWSLILSASADLIILLYEAMGPVFGLIFNPSHQVFNFPSVLMLIVFLGAILVKCIKEQPAYRDMVYTFTLLAGIGIMLSFLRYPTGNFMVSLGLPFVIGLLAASLYRVSKWVFTSLKGYRNFVNIRYLAYFGVAVLLLGVFVSSSMAGSATAAVPVHGSFDAFGMELSIVQISTSPSPRQIFLPPYGMVPESIDTQVSYALSDAPSEIYVLDLRYYPALNQYLQEPSIHRSLLGDIYIVGDQTESISEATALAFKFRTTVVSDAPADVQITAMRIPAILLVWVGVAIMVSANVLFVISNVSHRRDNLQTRNA